MTILWYEMAWALSGMAFGVAVDEKTYGKILLLSLCCGVATFMHCTSGRKIG